jgi:hypothetical protein
MSGETTDQYLLSRIRSSGVPVCDELLEYILPAAERAAKETGVPLEFCLVEQAKAAYAEARQGKGFGVEIDFAAYVRSKVAKSDSLLSRLLGRKDKVAKQVADLAAYEADINQTRESLRQVVAKIADLNQQIEQTTGEFGNHSDSAVEQSITEAAKLWNVRHRSDRNGSIVDDAIFHAVHADVVLRVLNYRLVMLKDELSAAQTKKADLEAHLRDLEKKG